MKPRHAVALALIISALCACLPACSSNVDAIDAATKRAQDAAIRSEAATKKTEYYANQARSFEKKASDGVQEARNSSYRANDAVAHMDAHFLQNPAK